MYVYMGVQYRVEVVFMNACVRVWLAFFAVWDAKNLFVFGAQCMYCRTCEHLPVCGSGESSLMNVSMGDPLFVHADVVVRWTHIIIPHLSSMYLLHM